MKPVAWTGSGGDGVIDITQRLDIADQWTSDGLKVEPLVTLSAANAAIEERDKRIAELETENAGLLQSSRHSADWATSAIADMKAAEARAASLEAMVVEAGDGLHDLERYVALNCFDQWLPEGHAKTSVLSRKLDAARSIAAKIGGRNGE